MKCSNCGNEIDDNAKFCKFCGNKNEQQAQPEIIQQPQSVQPQSVQSQPIQPQPVPVLNTGGPVMDKPYRGMKKSVIAFIVIVSILVGILGGALLVKNLSNKSSDTGNETTESTTKDELEEEDESSENVEKDAETADVNNSINEPTGNVLENQPETTAVPTQEASLVTQVPTPVNDSGIVYDDSFEGLLASKILELNTLQVEATKIDVYASSGHSPSTRSDTAKWNNAVFYTLEKLENHENYYNKDLCDLTKRQYTNKSNGNIIQYDVYLNPQKSTSSKMVPNKIVSIEYVPDGLEITEYYFTNKGKINFIFQYDTDNYIATYATPDKKGDRYLFDNDQLVTWRSIGTTTNQYVTSNAEKTRLKGTSFKNNIHMYNEMSASEKKAFDKKEKRMLNAAYNTYDMIVNNEGVSVISGYVYQQDDSVMDGAKVRLYANDFDTLLYETDTENTGLYEIIVPNTEYEYNLKLEKDGKTSCDIHDVKIDERQIGVYQESVYMLDENAQDGTVDLKLGDAFEYSSDGNGMVALPSATVKVRSGMNNKTGKVLDTQYSDYNGNVRLTLKAGSYTVEISADGHETMYYNIVSNPFKGISKYEFYAPKTLTSGEYAIVLTWGYNPSDLDSHLFTTNKNGSQDHIWYGDKDDDFYSYLDVDDTDSYGPETVTIRSFKNDSYYKYCVVDYTNCVSSNYSSYAMSNSGACVNVYSPGGLIATFHVPKNSAGVIWEVFEIRNGVVTPIQRYYNTVVNNAWWNGGK